MRELAIDNALIGDGQPCFVVAEIGHNHQGDVDLAKLMIKAASESGASAAKLQKRSPGSLFTPGLANEPYRSRHAFGPTYLEHRKALELDEDAWRELAEFSRTLGITFFGTAFDEASADLLADIGAPVIKIASGDAMNWRLTDHVSSLGLPMFVSTGGLGWDEVDATVGRLCNRNASFAVLQCTSAYPCQPRELELRVVSEMRRRYPEVVVGYSGHEEGIIPSLGAVALGAAVIERHFTTDQSLKGSDHKNSLNPRGLSALVEGSRELGVALGTGRKRRHPSEDAALRKLGKKLIAARDLPKGHRLTDEDLDIRSPGDGTSPHLLADFVGRELKHNVSAYDDICEALFL